MRRFFAFLLVGCLGGWLYAQEAEPMRSFRVVGYGFGDFQGISVEIEGEEEAALVGVEFVPNRKSKVVKFPKDQGRLVFYQEKLNERGKESQVEIARIDWPGDAEKASFVFLERGNADGAEPYEVLVLDESQSVWGPRCVRFLNLSGARLDTQIRDFRFPLEEGLSEILCFDGEYSIPMTLEFSLPHAGRKQIVYSARFVADQYSPKLLVVKPPQVEGSLKVAVDTLW